MESSPPDIFTQYFLNKAGLEKNKDYKVIYSNKAEHLNLLLSGKAEYAVSIESDTTTILNKVPKFKIIIDFDKEWQK